MDCDTHRIQCQIQALHAIAEAINTTRGRKEILETILRSIVTEMGYRAAMLRLLDAEHKVLNLEAAFGLSQTYLEKGEIELGHSLIDQRVFAGETVALRDVTTAPGFQYPEAAAQEGLRGVLVVPLHIRDRITGVLRVYTTEPYDFSQDEQDFLSAVANLAARAIANTHLYETLHAAARNVNSTLKVHEVLNALLDTSVAEMNYKASSIRLFDPEGKTMRLVAARGLSQQYLAKGEVRVADSLIDQAVLRGEAVTLYDVQVEPGFQYPEAAVREGIRSVLAVPLQVRGKVIGVLRVYSGQPHRFTSEEVDFLGTISDLGAIAIENARLHEALKEKYEQAREDWSGWFRFLALS